MGKENMKADRSMRAGNLVAALRGISTVSYGHQERNKKVREENDTALSTKSQFIIRLRNKREVNQGNMLEKW